MKPNTSVTFIRHYKLTPPYDKRETLTSDIYNQLSMGKVNPEINSDIIKYLLSNYSRSDFEEYGIILTSTAKSSRQSAEAITKIFNLDIPIQQTKLLNEAIWDPSKGSGRMVRFISGDGPSSIVKTWKRIDELIELIKSIQKNRVLCITHSFLMKNIYLRLKRGIAQCTDVKAEDLHEAPDYGYLEGFTTTK